MFLRSRSRNVLHGLAWLALAALGAQPPSPEQVWQHFADWVRNSPPSAVRHKPVMDLCSEKLQAEGLSEAEARARIQMISGELRQKSRENSALYWDAMFRFGGGPERPLPLLVETVRDLPPGDALDIAMGNGRNSLYLASLGWRVTGYDISPEGLALARQRAKAHRVEYAIHQCGHREFDFGKDRWDLILFSYIVADEGDLESVFGRKLWDSLRSGGRVICEGNFCEPLVRHLWKTELPGMRLERYSDMEDYRDGWAADNVKGRVIRAVIRKLPPQERNAR
jgi:SAM-dependent methyltransferase